MSTTLLVLLLIQFAVDKYIYKYINITIKYLQCKKKILRAFNICTIFYLVKFDNFSDLNVV